MAVIIEMVTSDTHDYKSLPDNGYFNGAHMLLLLFLYRIETLERDYRDEVSVLYHFVSHSCSSSSDSCLMYRRFCHKVSITIRIIIIMSAYVCQHNNNYYYYKSGLSIAILIGAESLSSCLNDDFHI